MVCTVTRPPDLTRRPGPLCLRPRPMWLARHPRLDEDDEPAADLFTRCGLEADQLVRSADARETSVAEDELRAVLDPDELGPIHAPPRARRSGGRRWPGRRPGTRAARGR